MYADLIVRAGVVAQEVAGRGIEKYATIKIRAAGVVDYGRVVRIIEIDSSQIVRARVVDHGDVIGRIQDLDAIEAVRAGVVVQNAIHAIENANTGIHRSAGMDVAVPDDEISGGGLYEDPGCERRVYVPSADDIGIGNNPCSSGYPVRGCELGVAADVNYTMRGI